MNYRIEKDSLGEVKVPADSCMELRQLEQLKIFLLEKKRCL